MNKRVHIYLILAAMVGLCVASAARQVHENNGPTSLASVPGRIVSTLFDAPSAPIPADLPVFEMPAVVATPTREERIAAFAVKNPGEDNALDMPFFSFGGSASAE